MTPDAESAAVSEVVATAARAMIAFDSVSGADIEDRWARFRRGYEALARAGVLAILRDQKATLSALLAQEEGKQG